MFAWGMSQDHLSHTPSDLICPPHLYHLLVPTSPLSFNLLPMLPTVITYSRMHRKYALKYIYCWYTWTL